MKDGLPALAQPAQGVGEHVFERGEAPVAHASPAVKRSSCPDLLEAGAVGVAARNGKSLSSADARPAPERPDAIADGWGIP